MSKCLLGWDVRNCLLKHLLEFNSISNQIIYRQTNSTPLLKISCAAVKSCIGVKFSDSICNSEEILVFSARRDAVSSFNFRDAKFISDYPGRFTLRTVGTIMRSIVWYFDHTLLLHAQCLLTRVRLRASTGADQYSWISSWNIVYPLHRTRMNMEKWRLAKHGVPGQLAYANLHRARTFASRCLYSLR